MFMYGHLNKHLTMLDIDLLLFCRLVLSLFDIPNIDKAIKQIYPQISVHSGYRDEAIGIMSIKHKRSQLWDQLTCNYYNFFEFLTVLEFRS